MKIERQIVAYEDMIKILGLPDDVAILDVKRNEQTLSFEFTIQGGMCEEKQKHDFIQNKFFKED